MASSQIIGEDDDDASGAPPFNRYVSIAKPGDIVDNPPNGKPSRYEDNGAFAVAPPPKGNTGGNQKGASSPDRYASNPLMNPTVWGNPETDAPPTPKSSLDDAWDSSQGNSDTFSTKPSLDDLWNSDGKNASSPKSVSTTTDVAKSGASGFRSGVEGLLGLPGDIDAGGRWLVAKALEKVGAVNSADDVQKALAIARSQGAGFNLPRGADIHAAGNSAGVPDYTPQTTAGKYAKTVGEFAPGALTMPETEIGPIAGNLAKYALIPGAASETAGQLFEGTRAEPYVRGAAGLVGGLGAETIAQGARAGWGAAKQFVEPLTQAGQQNWAARNFQGMFSDPDAAQNALRIAKAMQAPGQALGEVVPGSRPTTGQLTGDMGALSQERAMATADPAFSKSNPFGTGSEQQNAARTQALEGIQPTGSPEAVGQAVRDRLAQIEAEHSASNSAALQAAQQGASGIGSGATPEAIGANLRDALQSGRNAAKANERQLWNAVDPDGTLAMPATPIAKAATDLAQSVPKTAKPMAGEEAAIFDTAANLPSVAPFGDITALRSRISTAMREEAIQNGQSPAYARLAQLRGSVENAITSAAEHKAAQDSVNAGLEAHAGTPQVQGNGLPGVSSGEVPVGASAAGAPANPGMAQASRQGDAQLRASPGNPNVRGNEPGPNGQLLGPGKTFFPSGSLNVNYELREAPDLVTSHDVNFNTNPAYPQELQPRERSSAPAQDQVNAMSARLQPERLGRSPEANSGAPIIGPGGVVESGNGRTLAIQKAYAAGRGDAYRGWLEKQGVDTSGYKQPVLVARRTSTMSPEERVAFAHSANTASGLAMTDAEKAFADAKLINPQVLSGLDDAPVASAQNREFVRSFLKQLSPNERGDLLGKDGSLSQKGIRRVEMAVTAKAFGDPEFIDRAFVSPDLNVRSLAGALTDAAPSWAKMREAARTGAIDSGHDVTPDLMTAVRGALRAKAEGRPVADVLNNGDLFGNEASAQARSMILKPSGNLASRDEIAGRLQKYAGEAQKNLAGPSLFGDTVTPSEVMRAAMRSSAKDEGAETEPESISAALKPGPQANMDEAAAQRLKAASAATKDRAQTFDQGPVGSVLKTSGQQGDYKLADALVPGKIFAPGPAGAQTIAAYRKAAGPQGEAVLHDAAAQSLGRAAMDDGVLNPAKYETWAAKHQDALRALPDALQAKFANAASASRALDQAAATRKAALDQFQKSTVGKFLKLSDSQDVTRTVGGMFEANDGVRRMSELADAMKGNPDAQQGLRKAVADYILSKAKGVTEAGASGIANLNAGRFQTLIRNNAQTLKAAGFSDEEIGLMRAIGDDMQRSQRTLQATRLPGQSNTAQDLLKHINAIPAQASHASLLGEILTGSLGGLFFDGLHGATIGGIGGVGEHIVRQLISGIRNAGIGKASTLVRDAMFNPELAHALLEKTPTKVGVGAYANLRKALGKMSVFTTETGSHEQRKQRADGGRARAKLSHEQLVQRLMDASEQAKIATKKDTKAILNVSDNLVAKALAVAQRAI